jgi:RHS repeat-associated protein
MSCLGLLAPVPASSSPPSNAFRFLHDPDGRLKAAIDPEGGTAVYNWDPAGNLVSISRYASSKLSIVQLSPPKGEVGATVTIEGTGFSATPLSNTVKFNGTTATVSAASPTSLTVKVPAGATTGTVTVATPGEGPVASPQSFEVTASSQPTISSLSPNIAAAGEVVSMTGSSFGLSALDNVVRLNGTPAAVETASASSIKFNVPPARLGGRVSLATVSGSATGPDLFVPPAGAAPSTIGSTGRISLGESKTITISTASKRALLLIDGTKDQKISLTSSEASFTGNFSLYRPSGASIDGGSFSKTSNGIATQVLPETGTYTIEIKGTGTEVGSVKLTGYTVTDISGTITPTETGATKSTTFTTPGQTARYTVPGTAGEKLAINRAPVSLTGSYNLELVDPSGARVSWNWWEKTKSGLWTPTFTLASTGNYTLVVDGSELTTGQLDLTLWDASDITGGTITPTAEGETKSFSIKAPTERNLVTFTGTSGQLVTLKVTEATFTGTMSTWTSGGTKVTNSEKTFSSGGTAKAEITLPSTGTYTIRLEGASGATGTLKLSAWLGSHISWLLPAQPTYQLVSFETLAPPSPHISYSDIADPPSAKPKNGSRVGSGDPGRGQSEQRSAPVRRQPEKVHTRMPPRSSGDRAQEARSSWLSDNTTGWRPEKRGAWLPPRSSFERGWVVRQPGGPWAKIAPLQATRGTTAVAGQILKVDGLPLVGARVALKGTSKVTRTGRAGRFILGGLPSGHQVLVMSGEAAPAKQRYGSFEVGVDLRPHRTTILDYTSWMTPLDKTGNQSIASPTRYETRIRTPRIPGFEVQIPAGTVIRNAAGDQVKHLNITAIPVNRPAFPLPPFLSVPLYFTVQPGRAYLSKGARVIYPNWGSLPAGQRVDFWNYDPADQGWHVYGRGEVTPDGKQVVPDPGVRVWQFTGAMVVSSPPPPGEGPGADGSEGGDPVDLGTGLFTYHHTDLVVPDTIPIEVQRTYRPKDGNSYSFGRGATSLYDLRLWSTNSEKEADLILPDGGRVHFVRTSPGSGESDAVFQADRSPGPFSKAKITYAAEGSGWDLKLADGTTYVFDPFVLAPLREIRDRYGNHLTFIRSGENITQITSPHGRWVKFQYDSSNRITEVTDNGGRHFKYTYTSGDLTKVEAPEGRTTQYEYDGSHRMKAIVNPRGNKYLQIAYDANGRVEKQTAGDGAAFNFAYALDESGDVEATTVTDPVGNQREVEFNADGYPTSETEAPGTALARTTSFERQPETGLVLSETDPLGHETAFEYDGSGNVTEVTRLSGSEEAATSKYKYAAGTDRLTEATDPLSHTTKFEYGPDGELVKKTDPLGHETTIQYSGDGQPIAVTNPAGEETKLSYSNGDLVSVTDPLGRTTSRFLDALGRVRAVTSPEGQRMLLSYNAAGQMTSVKSSSGAETAVEYDADGNPVSVTDPRGNETTFSYDVMDRLVGETDALEHTAEWSYDKAGDVVEAIDRNGRVATFSYDQLRRMTSARYGVAGLTAESSIGYDFDLDNRVTGVTDSASGEYVFDRDPFGRIESLEAPTGTVSYVYDAAGRREAMLVSGLEPLYYSYDAADQLTGLSRGSESVALAYDKAGRKTGITLPNGIEQQYGYDVAGQTTSISYEDGATTMGEIDYAYDANGREEAMWGSYARLALPEALNTAEYDADNQLVKREGVEASYDKDGNLLSDGANEYTWNAKGQLTGISGESSASFGYDPFGRRTSKTIAGTTTELLFDGANVALEAEEGEISAVSLAGLQADQLFARTTASGTDSYLTDRLGSTIAVADEAGEVTTSYTYEPFGQPTAAGEPSDNPYQFTGRENDGTGFQYNRARYYDFGAGRFISQDPAGFKGSGANFYWYAYSDPRDFRDPHGLDPNPFAPLEHLAGNMEHEVGEWVTNAEDLASDAVSNLATSGGWLKHHLEVHGHSESCLGLQATINLLTGCPEEEGGGPEEGEEWEKGQVPTFPIDPQHPVPVEPSTPTVPIRPIAPIEVP